MNTARVLSYNRYRIGTVYHLETNQVHQLVTLFETPDASSDSVLGGRRSIDRIELSGMGTVVVKHYRRGGLLAHLNKKTYLMLKNPRSQLEFEQMQQVRKIGIQTPEPVAYAYTSGLFYRAWLITREIKNQQSLAELSRTDPDRARKAAVSLAGQVNILIANGVYHADFHPGNILVDDQERVYIIDFDKAGVCNWSRERLLKKYRQRWHRAVCKHGLPDLLIHVIQDRLG